MKKLFITSMMLLVCIFNADAAVKVKNNTANKYMAQTAAETGVSVDEIDDSAEIAILENDIAILDEEIAKCEKQKKGWIAATVIGSAGVLSTGIAAGVQGAQIKQKKDTLVDKKEELKTLTETNNSL